MNKELKPMHLAESLLYFGIPAALFFASFHFWRPMLETGGMLPYYAYLTSLALPLVLIFLASFVFMKWEGRPLNWEAVKSRFRLKRMDRKTWLGAFAIWILAGIIGTGLFGQLSMLLIRNGVIPLPASLPEFMDPFMDPTQIPAIFNTAVGGLAGNWLPALALFVVLFFNIFGEEFWWRGLILPRQELAFGKHAWMIHGVLWAFFHIFKWWDVLTLLPITLALSWYAQRKQSTTPGIAIHYLVNGIGLLPFILGALGLL